MPAVALASPSAWPRPAWSFIDIPVTVIGGRGVAGLVVLVGMALAPTLVPGWPRSALTAVGSLLFAGGTCLGVGVLLWRRGVSWSAIGLGRAPWRAIALMPLVAISLVVAEGTIFLVLKSVLSNFVNQTGSPAPTAAVGSAVDLAWLSLNSIIGAPFAEEMAFRGLLYRWLRARVSTRWAVLATALPFALFHVFLQPIPLLVPLFILGIVLAVVVERTRSLYPAIILHSTYNLIIGSLNVIPALVA